MKNEEMKNEQARQEAEGAIEPQKEAELSDEALQTQQENRCREHFIHDWVIASDLSPEQKVAVSEYINTQPGAWREYNGHDFKVVAAEIVGHVWKVSFGVYFDDYEAQRIDVEIPLMP